MTIEQAKQLKWGQIIYLGVKYATNADGTPQRYKVTGRVQTWKRDANRVRVPLKRGLKGYGELTERNHSLLFLTEEEAKACC